MNHKAATGAYTLTKSVSPVSVVILKILPDAVQGMVFAVVDTFIGEVYQ